MANDVTHTPPQALLARYKQVTGLATDYAVAKHLDVTPQAVQAWNAGGGMTPDVAVKIAEAIGMPPMAAIAEVRTHAAKRESERAVWEKYRARVLVAALVALGAVAYLCDARHETSTLEIASVLQLIHYAHLIVGVFIAAIQIAFRPRRMQRLRPHRPMIPRTA